MERWSYDNITDVRFRASLEPLAVTFTGHVQMEFSDGVIEVSKRQAFLNLYWLQIPLAFGIPLRKDHYFKRFPFQADNMTGCLDRYYNEIMNQNEHNAKKLKQAIWDMLQELYRVAGTHLISHLTTLDILDMAEIMTDPKIKPILETKEQIRPELGSDVIEKFIDTHRIELMNLFNTKGALKNEALYPYSQTDNLNKFQVPQTIYSFGVRTDINDNIVGYPVVGSALDGLRNIWEYAVESLSAKKSQAYNHVAVSESQYFGRKQHLIASSIQRIYSGDCGSTQLVKFDVTEKNYKNLIGKVIYEDGKKVYLVKDNLKSYIGKTIYMRSPMTCRYRHGVCETCGGLIFKNINRKINLGILSAVHVIEPTTQKILSAKHLIKTNSIVYNVPKGADQVIYRSSTSELRWKTTMQDKISTCMLGVAVTDFPKFHDVTYINRTKPVKEEGFSAITHFVLRKPDGKEATYILQNQDQVPFFSSEMLLHIRDHLKSIKIENDMVWIPLAGAEKLCVFKTIVVNDNMLIFVKRVSGFLSRPIAECHSCSEALQEFSNIVHDKVVAPMVHLEVLLKAYQITSADNYQIPRVENVDDVHFQTTASILTNRHIGNCLAFQGLDRLMGTPSTYLVPKSKSPFDLMVGYPDY